MFSTLQTLCMDRNAEELNDTLIQLQLISMIIVILKCFIRIRLSLFFTMQYLSFHLIKMNQFRQLIACFIEFVFM